MRHVFWLFALIIGLAFSVSAQALPAYQPGEVFIFDNGRVEEVRAVDGERVVWAARSGRTYLRSANPVVPILEWSFRGQVGERRIQGNPNALWPLRAGASAQFRTVNIARGEDGRGARRSLHLWQCRVQGQARVQTPAGAFDAFPIVCDRFSPASMRVLERITWHFAPEVGHYVRREARNMRDGATETFSLYASLPPREANALRIEALARQARAGRG